MSVWVVNVFVCEALTGITKEGEEKIALIVVLSAHDLVKTLFTKCLHQSLFACHMDTFRFQLVLFVEVWRVAAVHSV